MPDFLNIVLYTFAVLLSLAGVVGCILPYPGHLCILAAAYCATYTQPEQENSIWIWVILYILTILGSLVDNVAGYFGAKKFGASKPALYCCLIGAVIGAFFFPFGLILGPLIGAFIGDFLIAKRKFPTACRSAMGGLIGFILGVVNKLFIAGIMMVIVVYLTGVF